MKFWKFVKNDISADVKDKKQQEIRDLVALS